MSSSSNFTQQRPSGATRRELAELELPSPPSDGVDVDDGAAIRYSVVWALPWLSDCCSVVVIRVDVGLRRCVRAHAMALSWRCRRLSRLFARWQGCPLLTSRAAAAAAASKSEGQLPRCGLREMGSSQSAHPSMTFAARRARWAGQRCLERHRKLTNSTGVHWAGAFTTHLSPEKKGVRCTANTDAVFPDV